MPGKATMAPLCWFRDLSQAKAASLEIAESHDSMIPGRASYYEPLAKSLKILSSVDT